MAIKDLAISLVLIGLFAFALLSFGIGLAADNNANQSISDDPRINTFQENVSNQLGSYNTQVKGSSKVFSEDTPTVGGESLQLTSVSKIWSSIVSIPKAVYSLTIGLILDKIFGGTGSSFAIVFTVISSILVVLIILFSWAWIRGGIF